MRHSTMMATAAFATLSVAKLLQRAADQQGLEALFGDGALGRLDGNAFARQVVEKPSEVDYNVAYTSIAAGDTTFIATNWQPLHDEIDGGDVVLLGGFFVDQIALGGA
jgi:hypothetical protein